MKRFAPALIFCGAAAFGQSPQVPHKMQFAGMTLSIRDDARREIQKDVDALTLHPKYYSIKAERAKTYFPIIEKIFAEERLPEDFKYLALQESALVPDAVSSSNAVGFWQFKDFTAREMGLRVDQQVDERMNIASASRGAARYLKQCNHYFNNWVYALQSYQMGAGGVMRAVGDRDLGTRNMEITSDTYWYVKKFLAHKVAFENGVSGKPELEVSHLKSAGGMTLAEISGQTHIDEEKLREFNKWLKTERVPVDRDYAFLIPAGHAGAEFGVLAVTSAKARPPVEPMETQVKKLEINGVMAIQANKGETLEGIAKRGSIGIAAFLRYNEMEIDRPLQAGQWYFIARKQRRAAEELYTVKPGDDLWTISQRFAVRKKSLMRFNDLDRNSKLMSGVTLYMNSRKPAGKEMMAEPMQGVAELDTDQFFGWGEESNASARQAAPNIEAAAKENPIADDSAPIAFHEVKASDTLYSVARQYGVTIKELMEWNEKKDFTLSVGERLKVQPH